MWKKYKKIIKDKIDILFMEDIVSNLHEAGFHEVGIDYNKKEITGLKSHKKSIGFLTR